MSLVNARTALLLPVSVLLASCGYVGDPQPPALHIPLAVDDLRAVERGASLEASFTIPALTTDGLALKRAEIDLRAGPGPEGGWNPDAWAATAQPIPADGGEPGPVKTTAPITNWIGREIFVGVRLAGPTGRKSAWSNFVPLTVVEPVAAVRSLEAQAVPKGVEIRWQAAPRPDQTFRVLRRAPGEKEPAEIGLAAASSFLDPDTQYGKTYAYTVQAVVKAGAAEAESEIAAPVEITPEDRFAPAPPAKLDAVSGIGSIELAWSPSPEPDFRHYRVYRASGDGPFAVIADLLETPSYSDRAIESGVRYRYTVTALDQPGNESERPAPVSVTAP